MKHTFMVAVMLIFPLVQLVADQGKGVTVEGEVICLTCYLKDGLEATGSSHVACAEVCYSRGLPQAILDRESGTLYLPVTTEVSKRGTQEEKFVCSLVEHVPVREKLASFFGQTVSVTGTSFPGNGVTLLSIEKLDRED